VVNFPHLVSVLVGVALFQERSLVEIASAPVLAIACVPLLAGLSELVGQSFVLITRAAPRAQALASYALTGLIYVAGVSVWTGVALMVLHMVQRLDVSPSHIFAIVAVGYAPRLLGVLTIAPYYGELLGRGLDAWSTACVGWGLFVVVGASLPVAMGCAFAGWAANHLIRHFGGYLTAPVLSRLGLFVPGLIGA
jgi:hypothetical protein